MLIQIFLLASTLQNLILEIWPPANTVQDISQFIINLGDSGRFQYFLIQLGLFLILFFLTIYPYSQTVSLSLFGRSKILNRILLSDLTFVAFIVLFILMARIPLAVFAIQNPDEPLWVAAAKTLSQDPRIFVSADTGTGGPLVPLALLPLKWIGLSIDSGSVKIMAGGMFCFSVVCLFLATSKIAGSAISRLTVLPLVVAISVMRSPDMIAYNSEYLSIALLSLGLFLLANIYKSDVTRNHLNLILLGVVLGLVPFAKLQAVPIALFIGLSAIIVIYKRKSWKRLFILVISGLMPTLLILSVVWMYGGIGDFWISYVKGNLLYATSEQPGFSQRMVILFDILFAPVELKYFLNFLFTIILFGVFLVISLWNRISWKSKMQILFAVVLFGISVYCVILPSRSFGHYILLLILPLTVLQIVIIQTLCFALFKNFNGKASHKHMLKLVLATIFLCTTSVYYFKNNITHQAVYLENANKYYNGYAPVGELAAVLNHYYSPGARIATWEYEPEVFEGNDYLMGTRFSAFTAPQGQLYQYYIDTYLRDLQVNKPRLFIESFYRTSNRFENVSEVKKHIDEHYILDVEMASNNIYVRKEENSAFQKWLEKDAFFKPTDYEFSAALGEPAKYGSFLGLGGWAILGDKSDQQLVTVALIGKSDTLYMKCFQLTNKSVADTTPDKANNQKRGYACFIPFREIPSDDYQVGIFVENEKRVGFKIVGSFSRDTVFASK